MATTTLKRPHEVCTAFERSYAGRASLFGRRPSPWVADVVGRPGAAGKTALDVGCGHGRNTLHLARMGFDVAAVDVSGAAIRQLGRRASREGLKVRTLLADVRGLPLCPSSYDVVVAVTVLGLLDAVALARVAERIQTSLRPGGMLLVEEFSRLDPGCSGRGRASEFAGLTRHYFDPADIRGLFGSLRAVACGQALVADRSHGRPHSHGLIRYAARKPACT